MQKLNSKAEREDMVAIKKILQSFDAKLHEINIKDLAVSLHTLEQKTLIHSMTDLVHRLTLA